MAKRSHSRGKSKAEPSSVARVEGHPAQKSSWDHRWIALIVILVLAAGLRLVGLGRFGPPGLNQDEAANAWNAYCLLETGKDQAGVSWPIFYSRCLGANRSTLYLYVLMPFQAIGGLSPYTTRLPSALGGVLTVLLTYVVGKRLFGRDVGLIAAGLLAVNPWHVQQSRWGHEGALCTLLVMTPMAMLLWAGAPFVDRNGASDTKGGWRIGVAVIAGLLTGICCYGYPAVRLFLPLFLLAALAVTWRGWWEAVWTRRGAAAIAVLALGVALTFGPLAWQHLTDKDQTGIAKRTRTTMAWEPGASFGEKVWTALKRYPGHFGPDFLFVNGDHYVIQSVQGVGQFHWYLAPMLLFGLGVVASRVRRSPAARVLLVWVLVYPISDCLTTHFEGGLHALRASPGMCGLILTAALGAAVAWRWLWERQRPAAIATVTVVGLLALALNVRFLHIFFGEYNRQERVYHLGYHVDLLDACAWLRPKLEDVDAVFFTTRGWNQPYIVSLVGLRYDPDQWFTQEREVHTPGEWDQVARYGKIRFLYRPWANAQLNELRENGRKDRVLFVVRPGEVKIQKPLEVIRRPDGQPVLWIAATAI